MKPVHGNREHRRCTVARRLARSGAGVHGGWPCHAEIAPAPLGHGLRINGAPVHLTAVLDGHGATTLQTPAGPVRTVEHLLAALQIAGVHDARISVVGGEVPILDGSAAGWVVEALPQGPLTPLRLQRSVRVADGAAWAEAHPAPTFQLDVSIDFPAFGAQRICLLPADLPSLIDARTFGFLADVERLQAAGRARGAHLANTAVFADGPVLPLRAPDEPVRHKALDLLGDLALLGAPLRAHIRVHRGTHRLHHRLVAAILDSMP
jgi:UDP-3-O-[3-hydroxymyristoyl] N-acetylglucosamine deacetylase